MSLSAAQAQAQSSSYLNSQSQAPSESESESESELETELESESKSESKCDGKAASPKLPPELIQAILWNFRSKLPISIFNQPQLLLTLTSLSQVSHHFRYWALTILFQTLILPRSVREFKVLYSRLQQSFPPFNCSFFTRNIFSAIPDIGKLSSSSAGWESDLLRLLHYCGERVEVLSLWESESRVLLRDTGQVRGGREGVKKKLQLKRNSKKERDGSGIGNDGEKENAEGDGDLGGIIAEVDHQRQDRNNSKSKGGVGTSKPLLIWGDPLSQEQESDDDETDYDSDSSSSSLGPDPQDSQSDPTTPLDKEEQEAKIERERQTIPKWLELELKNSKDQNKVIRHYKAHLTPNFEKAKMVKERIPKGCKPKKISLMFQLPIFEHEDRELFRRMLCWKRCEELDFHVPITSHVDKALWLFSSLHSSPIRRLRISSIHATLVLALPPFSNSSSGSLGEDEEQEEDDYDPLGNSRSRGPNSKKRKGKKKALKITKILEKILKSQVLRESLLSEFTNSPLDDVKMLERALLQKALEGTIGEQDRDQAEDRLGFGRTGRELIRIKVVQGNQAKWGKLKERLNDFLDRTQGGQGSWKTLGVWDD